MMTARLIAVLLVSAALLSACRTCDQDPCACSGVMCTAPCALNPCGCEWQPGPVGERPTWSEAGFVQVAPTEPAGEEE